MATTSNINPGINTFVSNAGGAAFGNPNIARQGQTAGATQVSNAGGGRGFVNPALVTPTQGGAGAGRGSVNPTNQPPPNVASAPKPSTSNVIKGLMSYLNDYQLKAVKDGNYAIADHYEIAFAPASLAQSLITKGSDNIDKSKLPFQNNDSAKSLDPARQSANNAARPFSASQGRPIVQFIDQIIRNSSYISGQSNFKIPDAKPDQDVQTAEPNQASNKPLTWYKISVVSTPLGYDNKRNDNAYNMKFIVSTYPVNQVLSEYFPPATPRGPHKSYSYWFTGQNNEILSFEQDFNKIYYQIISNPAVPIKTSTQDKNNREVVPKSKAPTSGQSNQGADRQTNEIGASIADSLYSPGDQGRVKLSILGDPAWLLQGEVATGVNEDTFDFRPFLDDDTINFDASEVAFDVRFNRPQDYNLDTGVMDITSAKNTSQPQEIINYIATKCKSVFRDGKFTQELEGRLFLVPTGSVAGKTTAAPGANAAQEAAAIAREENSPGGDAGQIGTNSNTGRVDSNPTTTGGVVNNASGDAGGVRALTASGAPVNGNPSIPDQGNNTTETPMPTVLPATPPLNPVQISAALASGAITPAQAREQILAARAASQTTPKLGNNTANADTPQLMNKES